MKYGDRIIKMEGVIVELRDEIVAIDLKGRLGYLEVPMRMLIAEYPLKVGQEVFWDMSFVEQLGPKPEIDNQSVGEIKTLRKSDFVPTTRGAEDGDVIYIVDLENGGSAVMGADKRMEPIYAILDETKISPDKLTLTATRSTELSNSIEDFVVGALNGAI